MTKRLLVPWFNFSLNGGIARFISLARVFEARGREIEFASLTNQTETPWPELDGRILTIEEVMKGRWDAVMVTAQGPRSGSCSI